MPQLPDPTKPIVLPGIVSGDSLAPREGWYAALGLLLDRLAATRRRDFGTPCPQPLRCLLIGLAEGRELDALLAHALHPRAVRHPVELIILPGERLAAGVPAALAARLGAAHEAGWQALIRSWPAGTPGLHRLDLQAAAPGSRRVRVLIGIGDASHLVRQLAWPVDGLIVIAAGAAMPADDALARHPPPASAKPRAVPAALLLALKARSLPGSLLICTSPQPEDRDAIATQGFACEPSPIIAGWPAHALLAQRRGPALRNDSRVGLSSSARVAIIGAGLAGSACAAVLAREGWQVLLIDARVDPVVGNLQPRLADHPHLSPDDNRLARLSRQGLAAARRWREPAPSPGRLQLAGDALAAELQRRACRFLGEDAAAFVRLVDPEEATHLAGVPVARGGLWLPLCEAHDPAALAARWRAAPGIEPRFGVSVEGWSQHDDGWHLHGPDGAVIARADAIVIATAGAIPAQAAALLPALQRLRGQSTRVSAPLLRGLRCIVADHGYACPLDASTALVGASTDPRDSTTPDPADDQANLARLGALLPSLADSACPPRALGSAVGQRFSAPDRLPLAGPLLDDRALRADWRDWARDDRRPLPRLDGVHVLAGLGARGSLWAPLGAEGIADALAGRMPALERDLLGAIDPARFARQRLRQGLMP